MASAPTGPHTLVISCSRVDILLNELFDHLLVQLLHGKHERGEPTVTLHIQVGLRMAQENLK